MNYQNKQNCYFNITQHLLLSILATYPVSHCDMCDILTIRFLMVMETAMRCMMNVSYVLQSVFISLTQFSSF